MKKENFKSVKELGQELLISKSDFDALSIYFTMGGLKSCHEKVMEIKKEICFDCIMGNCDECGIDKFEKRISEEILG